MRIWNDIEWHMLQFPLCVFLPNPKGKGEEWKKITSVNVNTAMQIKTFFLKLKLFRYAEKFFLNSGVIIVAV